MSQTSQKPRKSRGPGRRPGLRQDRYNGIWAKVSSSENVRFIVTFREYFHCHVCQLGIPISQLPN